MELTPRIKDRIASDFGGGASLVIELLTAINLGQQSPDAHERISGAILIVADGDVDELAVAASAAEVDWRDVLLWAGLGD